MLYTLYGFPKIFQGAVAQSFRTHLLGRTSQGWRNKKLDMNEFKVQQNKEKYMAIRKLWKHLNAMMS
jgi:hypothetical protein